MTLDVSSEHLEAPMDAGGLPPSGASDSHAEPGNTIVEELDEAAQQKLAVIQLLLEPCDRAIYGERLRDAADQLGCSLRTVLRVLKPVLERKEKAKNIRGPGWRGSTLSVKTRDGEDLGIAYGNPVGWCDHTLAAASANRLWMRNCGRRRLVPLGWHHSGG